MPDLTSASTLVIAALGTAGGSALTLILQYFGSRFTESHKAALAATAKQKERYNEKQSTAVAACFEKLQKWEDAHKEVAHRIPRNGEQLDEKMKGYLAEPLANLRSCRSEFREFYDSQLLYLPKHLISRITKLTSLLQDTEFGCSSLLHEEPFAPKWIKKEYVDITDRWYKSSNLLDDLGHEFRKILGG